MSSHRFNMEHTERAQGLEAHSRGPEHVGFHVDLEFNRQSTGEPSSQAETFEESSQVMRYDVSVGRSTYGLECLRLKRSGHEHHFLLNAKSRSYVDSLPYEWLRCETKDGMSIHYNWRTGEVAEFEIDVQWTPDASKVQVIRGARSIAEYSSKWFSCAVQARGETDYVVESGTIHAEYFSGGVNIRTPSIHAEAMYGRGQHRVRANIASRARMNASNEVPNELIRFGIYTFPRTSLLRRRALVIACSYCNSSRYPTPVYCTRPCCYLNRTEPTFTEKSIERPTTLEGCQNDAISIIIALIEKGWQACDIVLLSDELSCIENLTYERLRLKDFHAYGESDHKNAVTWMSALVSGLEDSRDAVSTSLFLYFAGHGGQRDEFGYHRYVPEHERAVCAAEDDKMDEFIMLTDSCRVHLNSSCNIHPSTFIDHNMLSDNRINQLVCKPLFENRNAQLLLCFDSCSSGTCHDLPFCLTANDTWCTSGESRKEELYHGAIAAPWDCGKGIVWGISACLDREKAHETTGPHPLYSGGLEKSGVLTKAFCEALNRSLVGETTFSDLFRAIEDGARKHWEERGVSQTPVFSSSHACNPNTPMFI